MVNIILSSHSKYIEDQIEKINLVCNILLIFLSTDWCGATEDNFNKILIPYIAGAKFNQNNVFVYIYTNSNIGFKNTIKKLDSTSFPYHHVNYCESNNPIIHKREIKKNLKMLDKSFEYKYLLKGYVPVVVLYDKKNQKLIELHQVFYNTEF